MDQRDRTFVPHVLVVSRGSRVHFPNSDAVSHQVYSFSPAKRFQLPLYRGSPNPPVVFEQSGLVTLGCNIHDKMRGYVLVTEAQYHGRTDTLGRFSEQSVTAGNYIAQVWHPHARDARLVQEQPITLSAGTESQVVVLKLNLLARLREPATRPSGWDAY